MPPSGPIYLDYPATTPVDPRVLEALLPFLKGEFGNAASRTHAFGRRAAEAVEDARAHVASLLGARPPEIVFTSGATESINLALKGLAGTAGPHKRHLVTTQVEHRAVLDCLAALGRRGFDVTALPTDRTGAVTPSSLAAALRSDTLLVALIWGNNETGTLNPTREIGALCRERGVLLFTDATQVVGKAPVDVEADSVDLLALSGHKLCGPKGAGALYVRRRAPRVRLEPLIDGGGHERGLRSGTLNVPGIVGLGAACRLAAQEMDTESARVAGLRERLWRRLSELDGVHQNGAADRRLAGILNVAFEGVEAEELMRELDGIALSSGSACTSADPAPSHVLTAIGTSPARILGSIRFGLGRFTTPAEVDEAGERAVAAARRLRAATAGSGGRLSDPGRLY